MDHRWDRLVCEMNLQEIDDVMHTEFWREFMGRLMKKRQSVVHSYAKDSIVEEKQWLRHVKYQGEIDGIDWVLNLPEDIIREIQGTLGT